jgi:hypothetical protein
MQNTVKQATEALHVPVTRPLHHSFMEMALSILASSKPVERGGHPAGVAILGRITATARNRWLVVVIPLERCMH